MTPIFGQIFLKILSGTKPKVPLRHISLLRTNKTNDRFSPYIILKANKDDYGAILKLMHESFYCDEPTCYALGLKPNTIMDETATKNMAEGLTLVARCKYDGYIVGAAINESSNPWDPELKEKLACNICCPKIKHWLLFQAHAQRFPHLWCRHDVLKIFELTNIFIKKGVGVNEILLRKLIEESKNLATDCGHKVFRINATQNRVSDICDRMKMQLTAEIPYCSYLGKDLKPIFNPPHPNKSLKVFVNIHKKKD